MLSTNYCYPRIVHRFILNRIYVCTGKCKWEGFLVAFCSSCGKDDGWCGDIDPYL